MKTFEELGVSPELRRAIDEMGFFSPMPVQEAVIPLLLSGSRDTVALAQTGTGKTAAFGLPLLQKIDTSRSDTQALVLSPTRELCLQIADDLRDFSRYIEGVHVEAVYGGAPIDSQIRALKQGAHIIVATPGRLIDLMNRGKARLDTVANIVLDEADEMLNMGFSDSINAIFEALPDNHRTLMFSATMSREVERVANDYLHDAEQVVVGSRNEGAENVNHIYYLVQAKDKYLALKRIVDYNPKIYAIIFCRTKAETQEIADKLIRDGYNAEALHGDLSQQQRDLTMQKFRRHLTQLLVATDVAARGLDVDDLTHVINFSLPDDIESYTHRSGRTGRAGKKGTSISIIHSREKHKIRGIEKEIGKQFVENDIPSSDEICKKQLFRAMDQIVKTDVDDEQIAPFMADINRYFEYMDKEEIIKKMVARTFGRFLDYYADAPEIIKPTTAEQRRQTATQQTDRQKRMNKASAGFHRLFINLGKADGFYPGELMQTLNRYLGGRQEVGHIDLLSTISYFEVPEGDAQRVIQALNGRRYRGRTIRCNSEEEHTAEAPGKTATTRKADAGRKRSDDRKRGDSRQTGTAQRGEQRRGHDRSSGDWRTLMHDNRHVQLRGEEPDFSEDGWARRKPKKKKK